MAKFKCVKCNQSYTGPSRPLIGSCSKGGGHRWVSDNNQTSRKW